MVVGKVVVVVPILHYFLGLVELAGTLEKVVQVAKAMEQPPSLELVAEVVVVEILTRHYMEGAEA
jgi:SMC interacting uncharacterized protein involved in chromosome segregation